MLLLKLVALFYLLVPSSYGQMFYDPRNSRLYKNAMKLRNRITDRIMIYRHRNTAEVCYDLVGCFQLPHARSPLQKTPEPPELLNTKFVLFRRDINFSEPNIIYYQDGGVSLNASKFNVLQPLKIYIHGYMSNWNEKGALLFAESHLKLIDCNIIILDWTYGARGPQYATAAANTEVVGRQLGILLKFMVDKGLDPSNIHLIGFSLGAHVAGCASEWLKKDKKLIGRITALDAASPLFRTNNLKEQYKKLDKSDAHFVDVLHTDSSPMALDGFGLWDPIGHVDFFANGGKEQPGCKDKKPSIVVSQLEGTLTRDTACSHIRAYHLFLETIVNKVKGIDCEFLSYRCPRGPKSFENGECFPQLEPPNSTLALNSRHFNNLGVQGEYARGRGVLYFATTAQSPFCGTQLQATVHISANNQPIRGTMGIRMELGESVANFNIFSEIYATASGKNGALRGLAATERKNLDINLDPMVAYLFFTKYEHPNYNTTVPIILQIDKVTIRDIYGHSWYFCGQKDLINELSTEGANAIISIKLRKKTC